MYVVRCLMIVITSLFYFYKQNRKSGTPVPPVHPNDEHNLLCTLWQYHRRGGYVEFQVSSEMFYSIFALSRVRPQRCWLAGVLKTSKASAAVQNTPHVLCYIAQPAHGDGARRGYYSYKHSSPSPTTAAAAQHTLTLANN